MSLDLAVIIVGSLARFFDVGQDFCVIKDYKRIRYRNRYTGSDSVLPCINGQDYGVPPRVRELGPNVASMHRNEHEFLSCADGASADAFPQVAGTVVGEVSAASRRNSAS